MSDIRVRFAPSPTGYLHIGSARTALFNWLFARANKGEFILRIEDTDLVRSDAKYLNEILESLKWLGLNWDKDIIHQSKRFEIYKSYADKLIKEDKAYYEETEKGEAIRLRVPENEQIVFYDLVHDKIEVNSSILNDLVLMKSDGSPTYNFACVVDDADMKMSHIIRGDDHISNTPKQILIYNALGIKPPKFAHIPLILGEDKSRMSKRHGATSIAEYRESGYFPDALVNFLSLMGWSPKNDQEKMKLDKIVSVFSLKGITKTSAVFNIQKLNWLNSEYVREKPTKELTDFVAAHLVKRGVIEEKYNRQRLEAIVECYKTRFYNIDDLISQTKYIFSDEFEYDREAVGKYLLQDSAKDNLKKFKDKLASLNEFDIKTLESVTRSLADELGIKPADLIHPIRVAVTGREHAPGIFEVLALIGKARVLKRLDNVEGIVHKL